MTESKNDTKLTRNKNDRKVTCKMNVTFSEEEYNRFISGETHSDKGIRTNNGRLGSQPDIKVIDETERGSDCTSEYDYQYEYFRTSEKHEEYDGFAAEIAEAIVEGVREAITEILSDEENREILASMASNWWHGKVIFVKKKCTSFYKKVNTGTDIIRGVFSGKTKAELLLSERKEQVNTTELSMQNWSFIEPAEQIDNQYQYRKTISREEAQLQIRQIRVLAVLLADKIRKLSNAYVRDYDMSPEDYLIHKKTIEKLTAQEAMNSIKLCLENESFLLDDSTARIFSEFLLGNLIVGDTLVPIENSTAQEPIKVRIVEDDRDIV